MQRLQEKAGVVALKLCQVKYSKRLYEINNRSLPQPQQAVIKLQGRLVAALACYKKSFFGFTHITTGIEETAGQKTIFYSVDASL